MFHEFGVLAFLIIIYVLAAAILVLPAFIMLSEKVKAWIELQFPNLIKASNTKKQSTVESEINL
jgi:predicted RND superfamily exporter protein